MVLSPGTRAAAGPTTLRSAAAAARQRASQVAFAGFRRHVPRPSSPETRAAAGPTTPRSAAAAARQRLSATGTACRPPAGRAPCGSPPCLFVGAQHIMSRSQSCALKAKMCTESCFAAASRSCALWISAILVCRSPQHHETAPIMHAEGDGDRPQEPLLGRQQVVRLPDLRHACIQEYQKCSQGRQMRHRNTKRRARRVSQPPAGHTPSDSPLCLCVHRYRSHGLIDIHCNTWWALTCAKSCFPAAGRSCACRIPAVPAHRLESMDQSWHPRAACRLAAPAAVCLVCFAENSWHKPHAVTVMAGTSWHGTLTRQTYWSESMLVAAWFAGKLKCSPFCQRSIVRSTAHRASVDRMADHAPERA